jgi:hypothetical protein
MPTFIVETGYHKDIVNAETLREAVDKIITEYANHGIPIFKLSVEMAGLVIE